MRHSRKSRLFLIGIGLALMLPGKAMPVVQARSSADVQLSKAMGPPFYSGTILPTPKQVTYGKDAVDLYDGKTGQILCDAEFAYDGPARELLLRLLDNRIDRYKKKFNVTWRTAENVQPVKILFTLASNPKARTEIDRCALRERVEKLPAQGYVLDIRPEGVVCVGKDDQGMVNGLASFLQLLHVQEGKLVVQQARVVDWPTFLVRYTSDYSAPSNTEFFDWMMLNKINGWSCGYANYIDWKGLTDKQRTELKIIGDYVRKYQVMSYMAQIHIGGVLESRPAVELGNTAEEEAFLKTAEEVLKLSSPDRLLVLCDDVHPKLTPEGLAKFKSPGQAMGDLLKRLYDRMQKVRPGTKLLFCPPYYYGRALWFWQKDFEHYEDATQYAADIRKWDPNIIIFWTGPCVTSMTIDQKDIDQFQSLVGKERKLVLWDNTWSYHQPLPTFHAKYMKDFVKYCADGVSYVHIFAMLPIGKYFSMTSNDYYWNPDDFDAEKSWRNASTQLMGPVAGAVVEKFYRFRGDFVTDFHISHLAEHSDLKKFGEIVSELEQASWSPDLPGYFRKAYNDILKEAEKVRR